MSNNEAEREDVTVTNQNGPGLWYFARHAILEPYGFPSEIDIYQRRLVIWLRDRYADKLEDPNVGMDKLFFKTGSSVGIPAKNETATIIGMAVITPITSTGEIRIKAQFIEDFVRTYYGLNPLPLKSPYQAAHANMSYNRYRRVIRNQNSEINTSFR
jgi:hypothetical protein